MAPRSDADARGLEPLQRENNEGGPPARGSLPGGLATTLVHTLALFRERLIPAHREKLRSNQCQRASVVYISFLTETNLETSIDAARGYGRTSGNRAFKGRSFSDFGCGTAFASGCKDPMYQEVLSLPFAPELCSGAFSMRTLIADSRSGLIPLAPGTTVN